MRNLRHQILNDFIDASRLVSPGDALNEHLGSNSWQVFDTVDSRDRQEYFKWYNRGRRTISRKPGGKPKLNAALVADIKALIKLGHTAGDISSRYGVRRQTIDAIRTEKTWKSVVATPDFII